MTTVLVKIENFKKNHVYVLLESCLQRLRYLRCCYRSTGGIKCPGTGRLINGVYKSGVPHNHSPYYHYEDDDLFKEKLRKAVCTPGVSISKNIYLEIGNGMPEAAARYPYFPTAYSAMRRWNNQFTERKTLGEVSSMEKLFQVVETVRGKEFLKYSFKKEESALECARIRSGQANHLLIWDEKLREHSVTGETWHIDATYKVTPRIKQARQVMTIMARVKDQNIPFAWIVMERRKIGDYSSIFQYIKKKWIGMRPKMVIADFERALHIAAQRVFACKVKGCFFHFTQAVYRQAVKKGVATKKNNKEKDPEGHECIKKFMALALIPFYEILPTFSKLKDEVIRKFGNKWIRFVEYFKKTWIDGYGPEIFCVYGQAVRTNNAIEAYHRVLNTYVSSVLTASGFIRLIQKITKSYRADIICYASIGQTNRRSEKDKFYVKSFLLQQAWERYHMGYIKVDALLDRVTCLVAPAVDNLEHTIVEHFTEKDEDNLLQFKKTAEEFLKENDEDEALKDPSFDNEDAVSEAWSDEDDDEILNLENESPPKGSSSLNFKNLSSHAMRSNVAPTWHTLRKAVSEYQFEKTSPFFAPYNMIVEKTSSFFDQDVPDYAIVEKTSSFFDSGIPEDMMVEKTSSFFDQDIPSNTTVEETTNSFEQCKASNKTQEGPLKKKKRKAVKENMLNDAEQPKKKGRINIDAESSKQRKIVVKGLTRRSPEKLSGRSLRRNPKQKKFDDYIM